MPLRMEIRTDYGRVAGKEFLSLVLPQPLLDDETLELRVIKPQDRILHRSFEPGIDSFLAEAERNKQRADVYFGVATRRGQAGDKAGCSRVNALWVDFDGRDLKLEKLGDLQPHLVVDSGNGFHLYWLLQEPLDAQEHLEEIEAVNRGLCERLGGDFRAVDVTRILRVPDSLNHKTNPPKPVVAYARKELL